LVSLGSSFSEVDFIHWLIRFFGKAPRPVTNIRVKVIPMKEIDVSWDLPSTSQASDIAYTDVGLSTDGGKTFSSIAQIKPDATQIVKRAPAPDGNYVFRLTVVGVNGKKSPGKDQPVVVDTPAPGDVQNVKVTVL
jgi:hypothetical protein